MVLLKGGRGLRSLPALGPTKGGVPTVGGMVSHNGSRNKQELVHMFETSCTSWWYCCDFMLILVGSWFKSKSTRSKSTIKNQHIQKKTIGWLRNQLVEVCGWIIWQLNLSSHLLLRSFCLSIRRHWTVKSSLCTSSERKFQIIQSLVFEDICWNDLLWAPVALRCADGSCQYPFFSGWQSDAARGERSSQPHVPPADRSIMSGSMSTLEAFSLAFW